MVSKTGDQIRKEISDVLVFIAERNIIKDCDGEKSPSEKDDERELNELKNQRWYLASDIAKRKEFYDTYHNKEHDTLKKEWPAVWKKFIEYTKTLKLKVALSPYVISLEGFLYELCYSRLDESFDDILGASSIPLKKKK